MKGNRSILLFALSMLLAALFSASITGCMANRQAASGTARSRSDGSLAADSGTSETLSALQTMPNTSETAKKPDYTAVLNLIHSHIGPLYLNDITQSLDANSLKWAAYYNVSHERIDMTWEDGTTLIFLSPADENNSLKKPILTMLSNRFYSKRFEEYYLHQPDADPDAFYYPQTASRLLTKEELENMNQTDLSIARNEMFARHGRAFTEPFLQGIFTAKNWYTPLYDGNQFQYAFFNNWERMNLDAIAAIETARGYRFRTDGDVTRLRGLVNGSWISPGGAGTKKEVVYYSISPHYGGPGNINGYGLVTDSLQQYWASWDGDLVNYDPILYTASLNGKTTQLFVCGESLTHVPMTDVFTFFDGNLKYAGDMPGGSRSAGGVTEIADDGIHIYFPDDAETTYVYSDKGLTPYPAPSVQDTMKEAVQGRIDMPAAYRQFLDGTLAAANGLQKGIPLTSHSEESFFDKGSYTSPRANLAKFYALADTNGDGCSELFFKMEAGPDTDSPTNKILFILGFDGEKLKVYDMFFSFSNNMNFSVFDNGNVDCTQSYEGEQEVVYHYDGHGQPKELIRFVSSPVWLKKTNFELGHYYEKYYLNGDRSNPIELNEYYDYYQVRSQFLSTPVMWQRLPNLQHYRPMKLPYQEEAIKDKLAADSLHGTVNSNYAAVLNLIKTHPGVCALQDITLWLDGYGLKWEAYYNVSQERIDMTWEDGTTLSFLRSAHEDGSMGDSLLVMINGCLDSQLFQKHYLNQPDAKPQSGYFPQSAERLLSDKELWGMNQTDLSIARNEIYARHGLKFEDPFLQGVFSAKSWYKPLYSKAQFEIIKPVLLSIWEKENLKSIRNVEKERGFSLQAYGDMSPLRGLVSGSWITLHGSGTEKTRIDYIFTSWESLKMNEGAYELSLSLNRAAGEELKGHLVCFDRALYTASLDGTAIQFLVSGETLEHIPATDVYTVTNNHLSYAGSIAGSRIAGGVIAVAKNGIYVYGQGSGDSQASLNTAKYSFQDGKVIQISAPIPQKGKMPSEEALAGIAMPNAYRQFLSGGLELSNPFNREFPLSAHAEKGYLSESDYTFPMAGLKRSFSLTDADGDGRSELFYEITAGPKAVMFLLGLDGKHLKVYDVFDSRARSTHFTVYTNGSVDCTQDDNGEQEVILRYDKKGRQKELIRFVSSENWLKDADMSSGHYYEAYYLNGDGKNPIKLNSSEDYNKVRTKYLGENAKEAKWQNLADFST